MKNALIASRDLLLAVFLTGCLVLACQLGQETKVENTLSFSKHFDSLSRYDSLVIEIKDPDGNSLGIIFNRKPAAAAELDHLSVPDWDGGPIDIFISGYMKGQSGAVFEVKKRYDGKTGRTESTVVIIDPRPAAAIPSKLTLGPDTLRLAARGAAGRFTALIEPAGADRGLDWRLSDSTVAAQRSDGAFLGLARGKTQVWAACRLNPEIVASAWIVVTEPVPVASVRFPSDSLTLFLGGAPESLQVEVLPELANPEVAFTLSDTAKAALSGRVLTPKAPGSFTVLARSVEDTSKTDLLKVTVREAVTIDRVVAADSAVLLYLGGTGKTLAAQVLPAGAPQDVRWKSLSPAVVSADALTGAIAALQAGTARVLAMSAADSLRRDTVDVTVKIDAPRLAIAADSIVSAGAGVTFRVNAVQEYGQITLFQWDLDGNGTWDDSLTGPWTGASVDFPALSSKYDKAGPVAARFRARDGEGNATVATFALRVVGTSAVSIESPKNNSYTNQKRIPVEWSVNGVPQDSLKTQDLVAGPNVISRSARDSAGKTATASVTVTLDTEAPGKPVISGSSPTNVKPKWSWSAGGGGSGEYRYRLGDSAFAADAPTVRDTTYTLASTPVSGTTYTLYVQERDLAGNWSAAASLPIRYDVSSPVVAIALPQASGTYFTSAATVTLSGTASGPLAISQVNYKVGSGAPAKATLTGSNWSTAAIALTEGSNAIVTVTAVDQAGNSGEAVLTVLMDATVPTAPAISSAPAAEIDVIKGDFAWTAGSDGAAGSGLNGHYRYAINGGAWKDTTATVLTNLPLGEGSNVFAVQEQDRAGLWSPSASRTVKVDTTGPIITVTSHANPATSASLTVTLSGQVKDSGTAVAAMTVSGQQSGSGTITLAAGAWTSAALTLKAGANTLLITATDRVGNARTLTLPVTVSLPAPVLVITSPNDSLTITRSDTITVSYTIDGGAVQTKAFTLTEGVNRLVVTSPANASGKTGSDTVKVTRDATVPNAPTVTRGATPNKTAASWTWTSNGDNAGGAGMRVPPVYRYSSDAGVTWTQTGTASYQITAEGTWTLIVQEQDKAGNWSASSAGQTIVVDKTAPAVVITTPANNYVTRLGSVNIGYKIDNVAQTPVTCTFANTNGANTCSVSSTDAAGNVGTASITVYCRANVYFVTPGGAGNKSGSAWENAMDSTAFESAMGSSSYSGREFWVGNGIYTNRFQISYGMKLYGGFDASKAPFDMTGRDLTGSRSINYVQATPDASVTSMNFTMDGFMLNAAAASGVGNTVNFTNITLSPNDDSNNFGLYLLDGASVTATNLTVKNKSYGSNVIWSGNDFNLVGGNISGNLTKYGAAIMVYGKFTITNGAVISGNVSTQGPSQQVEIGGNLTIGSGVSLTCNDVLKDPGSTCTKN